MHFDTASCHLQISKELVVCSSNKAFFSRLIQAAARVLEHLKAS